MYARQYKLSLEQRAKVEREWKKAQAKRLAPYRKNTATKADKQAIADYLAREPEPRFYG